MTFGNIFIILLATMTVVRATSWRSREHEREHQLNAIRDGTSNAIVSEEDCEDGIDGCKNLKDLCHVQIVKNKCKDTCRTCRAASPPDCSRSKYGCCWDNVTVAKGSNQEECPLCGDQYAECSMFTEFCARDDIRKICPVTCGIDCKQCRDNEHQKAACPIYKRYGFCQLSPDLMLDICAKTCGFCLS